MRQMTLVAFLQAQNCSNYAASWRHAEAYYVKDGRPTSEQSCIRGALRFVRRLYGHTPARDFTPAALKAVRADLQAARSDIMAKNLTLTAEQAAKFWPMFNKYQQEQNVLMDDQLKTIRQYIDRFDMVNPRLTLGHGVWLNEKDIERMAAAGACASTCA